ncbi:MAG: PKD domain-containing protein [Flavobacteriales bacterium]|jgi:gliding motility-associated-like protein|nr:MAG: PKD domain-containing protein [Flavobacteriales bacterium]
MPSPSTVRRPIRYLWILALMLSLSGSAQIFTITDGSITTCTGAILDSGGQGAGGYGNNESYTATICPDAPGQGIHLNWVTFNLSEAGTDPIDNLAIYDGPSAADPLLGVFTGTSIQGTVVSASPTNPTGCLTLVFTSNGNGTGVFAAAISCVTPCFPPTAVADVGQPLPALVCPDEVITYDGSASTAAAGFTIVDYAWDLGDGTTASGPIVTHSFSNPGAYIAQLTVTDDNGCVNTQTVDLAVYVGTTPLFAGTTESLTVCQGATVDLAGAVQPVTWSAMPEVDFGDGVYLPDNVGQTFTSQIEYGLFPPGATLTNVNDLWSLCIDIEHSFMGDFVMTITCPNGQSTILHQQGGGGTNLGIANQADGGNPQPGTCWNYCFAPNAPNGTWAQSSTAGLTTPTATGPSLTPGTYSSVQPLNNLVGCPLNGTWTFSFTDLWGADNGFLCSWYIDFNPSLYPDLVDFTPTIGFFPDSMAWSGAGVTTDPNDPTYASFTLTDPGVYPYTFTVTDNFGCTYDTTITVTVTNAPEVEATAVLASTCSEPTALEAEIVAYAPPPPDCTYSLVLHDSFGDGWNGGANVQVVINGVSTSYSMPPGGNDFTVSLSIPFGATLSLIFTAGTIWNNENSLELISNSGAILYDSPNGPPSGTLWTGTGDCGPNAGPVVWQWTPAASVDDPNAQNTVSQITQTTTFVVRVYPFGQPWCFGTDTIEVDPPSFLENDSVVTHVRCNGGPGAIEIISTGLGGPWNYDWVDANGTSVQQTVASLGDTLEAAAGTYTVFVSEGPQGNGCADTLTATITEPPLLEWVTVPQDTTICLAGSATLAATAQGGTDPVLLVWSQGLAGNGPHQVSPPSGPSTFVVQAVDANGCATNEEYVTVLVREPLTFTPLEPDTECYGIPVPYAVLDAAGGDGAYAYDWGTGAQPLNATEYLLTWSDSICVTLTDGCETPPVTDCAWLEILHTPPIELTADTVFGCAPFSVGLTLRDTTEGAWIQWSYGDGAVEMDSASVIHTYANAGNYTVNTVITWPNGCITDTTITDMVRVLTVPIANMYWTPRPATVNEPVVRFVDTSVPNVVSWLWDFGELGTSEEQDPVIEFPSDAGGTYPVMLVVANELGCTDTLRSFVDVEDEFMVWVPNAFTPDGNAHNQTFSVSGNDLSTEEYHLIIFDRWGHEVFNSTDLFEAWDGTSKGTVLPQGTYTYRLKIRARSSREKRILYGHVSLLR